MPPKLPYQACSNGGVHGRKKKRTYKITPAHRRSELPRWGLMMGTSVKAIRGWAPDAGICHPTPVHSLPPFIRL
jgi:hypothetical protein